ncbi:hypothetical protein ACAW74_20945 [Fibrella sp. WM1]|uniref:hypothetical protein n=1 Tax=Fibrella musci TaxID=3242485 RepID=UPI00351FE135
MIASKRPILVFLLTNAIALSLVFALVVSCKKTDDPGTGGSDNLTTIQGNWRLTAININPGYTDPRVPFPVTELVSGLTLLEPNCATTTTLSFNNGTVTNNSASISSCTSATLTKQLINSFFAASTSYTEDANQLTVRGPQTVTYSKAVTTSTATLVTNLSVNPGGQPTPTSYTITMARQQ